MILNVESKSGDRIPVVRLVEPIIKQYSVGLNEIRYTAEYVVNRDCVLVGYADKREAHNIFALLAGLPNLDYSALVSQHGVIYRSEMLYREEVQGDTTDEEQTPGFVFMSKEEILDALSNRVCVIIE